MEKHIKVFDKFILKYAFPCFLIATFILMITRTPFFDEAYAYMISSLSIKEIFHLIPIEGHPFIWYFLLKIFCSNINLYPYPMLIMSWVFFSLFIYIFWKKAPFNNLIKFLITFSYLFLNYYAICSRPYSLSILIFSLLAVLYKNSTKTPFLYSFLILICFNVSVISMFGAGAFFILFVYKLIKEKENNKKGLTALVLLIFGIILSSLQFLNYELLYSVKTEDYFKYVVNIFIPDFQNGIIRTIFWLIRLILLFYVPFLLFKKSRESLFFIIFTYSCMAFLILKIYPLAPFWHTYFYFIFFMIALWLNWEKIEKCKLFNILFIALLIVLLSPSSLVLREKIKVLDTSHYKKLIEKIESLNKKESKFFSLDWYSHTSSGIIPYLKQKNIVLYDSRNYPKDTYNSMKNTYKYHLETFRGEDFIKQLDNNKDNYLVASTIFFSQGNNKNVLKFSDKGFYYKNLLFFRLIYSDFEYQYFIFKIEKLGN